MVSRRRGGDRAAETASSPLMQACPEIEPVQQSMHEVQGQMRWDRGTRHGQRDSRI